MKLKSGIIFLTFLIAFQFSGTAQDIHFKGMAAGWTTFGYSDQWAGQLGGRYLPQLDILLPLKDKLTIEGEFSANIAGSYTSPTSGEKYYGKIKPYRMWLKLSGKQFEVRAGLQKINFGSASMLRPLMWFDSIDPRDPLQLTDGVYGVLGRYYTLNNINIWGWGLYGNKNPKGWEFFETKDDNIEFGGRIQFPLSVAEIGFTYHNRKAFQTILPSVGDPMDIVIPENRFAADIKADIGIGLWIENALVLQDNSFLGNKYTNMLTVGADYTFGLGNGLNIIAENLSVRSDYMDLEKKTNINFSSMSLSYPLTLTANISGIIYYDWDNRELYRFLNLGLSYDKFSYYIMGFWNPERFRIFEVESGPSLFNGAGIQLMMVYNH